MSASMASRLGSAVSISQPSVAGLVAYPDDGRAAVAEGQVRSAQPMYGGLLPKAPLQTPRARARTEPGQDEVTAPIVEKQNS
jgi:hypothetical protein